MSSLRLLDTCILSVEFLTLLTSLSGSKHMKERWVRIIPYLSSNSIINSSHLHQLLSNPKFIHTLPQDQDAIANTICDSLRKGQNWDSLNRKFGSLELSNSIIQKVLLQLKEPVDAKRALGFFHWSAQHKQFKHEASTYCIAIHILVRSKLIRDAQTLLESVLKRSVSGNLKRFSIVDLLISSYISPDSVPLVFNLLVQSYAKLRMIESGFDVCQYLGEHGFSLSVISYNTLINVAQKCDHISLVWKIYEHMIEKRTYPNDVTVKIVISALCKEGKLQEFLDMVDRIHGKRSSPTVIVNTSLVFRILEEGRVEEGLVLLKRILQKNMILDTISYSLIVYAKVKIGGSDSA